MIFRVFGIAGFVSAFLYALYSYTLGVRIEKKMNERNKQVRKRNRFLFFTFNFF